MNNTELKKNFHEQSNSNFDIYKNSNEPITNKDKQIINKESKKHLNIIQKLEKIIFKEENSFNMINILVLIIIILIPIFFFNILKTKNIIIINSRDEIDEEYNYSFKDVIKSKVVNNEDKIDEKYIIGIDFGTINSGFSYSFDKDISKIVNNKKFSTEIELSKKTKKGSKYSYTASISLMNYKESELNNIIFIKGFKYYFSSEYTNNIKYNDNIDFKYPNEINIDKTNIAKQYFILLKGEILKDINIKQINNKNIKWIFAIPSSWNQYQKQIIKNCSIESEIYNINFIYESEAAALSMYYDRFISNKMKQKNKIFMLIDAGGYSIDITIYQIIDNEGTIKEIEQTQSFYLGILNINDKIIKIFEQIFGKNNIYTIKKKNPGSWIKTLKDINKAIESTYSTEGNEIFEINGKFNQKDNYKDYIFDKKEGKKYRIKYNNYMIYFPSQIIGKIIFENVNLIKQKIETIMKDLDIKKIYLDGVIVAGGFSKNKIFQKVLEKYFNNNNIHMEYLSSYESLISKGAVIYGIHPQKIKFRKSPITLGISKNEILNESDKIEILFRKGDKIKNFKILKFIKPENENQEYIKINIYISNNNYFDKLQKNNIIGKIVLNLNKENKGIIILSINYNIIISFSSIYENGEEIDGHLELEYVH